MTPRTGRNASVGLILVSVGLGFLACQRQEPPPSAPEPSAAVATTNKEVVELAASTTLEDVFYAASWAVDVQPCNGGSGCTACNDPEHPNALGLRLRDKTKVQCTGALGKYCFDGGAQIRWDFKGGGIQPQQEYRAVVQYTGTASKLTSGKAAYPKAYCRDASGNQGTCEAIRLGKRLAVLSGLPQLAGSVGSLETTYWPYRIDLYEVAADDSETLFACADPEIIVDPPGGDTFVPPGSPPADPGSP